MLNTNAASWNQIAKRIIRAPSEAPLAMALEEIIILYRCPLVYQKITAASKPALAQRCACTISTLANEQKADEKFHPLDWLSK